MQKRRSSTLYSIIPFLERKRVFHLLLKEYDFFYGHLLSNIIGKSRVPIDLKGEKTQNTPTHHLVHQKANHFISFHPQFNSVVSPNSIGNNIFKALEFHLHGA
jgi:hypothetical protein